MDQDEARRARDQLESWSAEIQWRAAQVATASRVVPFATIQHVGRLRALYATARACFATIPASPADERLELEAAFTRARGELAAAIDEPLPRQTEPRRWRGDAAGQATPPE